MQNIKLLLLFIFIFTINAQEYGGGMQKGVVRGSVVDELTELPLEYATITIIKSDSNDIVTGSMSDSSGVFFIDDIPYGQYKVEVERIGYESQIINEILIYPTHLMINLEIIKLASKAVIVEGVSITADAPIIEKIDKTIYPVKDTARESSGSAEEVLEQIPQVSVDIDGNIALRNNPNVKILINGRKSKMDVSMLNADMIASVEVMTIGSAKYEVEGEAGIINIILSKNEYTGKSGKIMIGASEWSGNNLSGDFNIFENDLNIFTNFSTRSKHRFRRGERFSQQTHNGNIIETIYSTLPTDSYDDNYNLRFGLEKYFDEISMFAFDLGYTKYDGVDSTFSTIETNKLTNNYRCALEFEVWAVVLPCTSDADCPVGDYCDFTIDSTPVEEIDTFTTREKGSGNDYSVGFGYYRDNQEKQTLLEIQMDHETDDYDNKFKYTDDSFTENTNDEGFINQYSIDYTSLLSNIVPFKLNELNKDVKIDFGVKYTEDEEKNYFDMVNEKFSFKYNNQINALYFNTQYQFAESFGVQFGARYETQQRNSNVDFTSLDNCTEDSQEICDVFNAAIPLLANDLEDSKFNLDRIFPSLYLLYDLSDLNKIKFGAGRRINRAAHWGGGRINPIPSPNIETKFIDIGNPYLLPEDIRKAEISLTNTMLGFFKTTLFYEEIFNKIDRDKDIIDINGDAYQTLSWDNLGETRGKGIELIFSTRPLPSWEFFFYGMYWDNNTVKAAESDQIGKEYGAWIMSTSKIKLKNDQKISIYAHNSLPMTLVTGEIAPFRRMDISYNKKVNDKFNFTLKLKDLFNTSGFAIITDESYDFDGQYTLDSEHQTYTELQDYLDADYKRGRRTLSLKFEYRFGAYEEKKYRRDKKGGYGDGYGDGGGMDSSY